MRDHFGQYWSQYQQDAGCKFIRESFPRWVSFSIRPIELEESARDVDIWFSAGVEVDAGGDRFDKADDKGEIDLV